MKVKNQKFQRKFYPNHRKKHNLRKKILKNEIFVLNNKLNKNNKNNQTNNSYFPLIRIKTIPNKRIT